VTIRQPKLEPDQRLSDENLEADQRTDMHTRTHTSERVRRLVVTVSDHSVSDGSLGSVSPASSHSDRRPQCQEAAADKDPGPPMISVHDTVYTGGRQRGSDSRSHSHF
jgi:hypothetical protein